MILKLQLVCEENEIILENFSRNLWMYVFIYLFFIYLFIRRIPNPATAGLARINAKEREARRAKKRKGIEAQRVKLPTPSREIDALIGDDGQKERKKKQGAGPQSSYPGFL